MGHLLQSGQLDILRMVLDPLWGFTYGLLSNSNALLTTNLQVLFMYFQALAVPQGQTFISQMYHRPLARG